MAKWDHLVESDVKRRKLYRQWLSSNRLDSDVYDRLLVAVSRLAQSETSKLLKRLIPAMNAQESKDTSWVRVGSHTKIPVYRGSVDTVESRTTFWKRRGTHGPQYFITLSIKFYVNGDTSYNWDYQVSRIDRRAVKKVVDIAAPILKQAGIPEKFT
jgi:hypothetical protein